MNIRLLKIQSGFALLIFLVVLMGIGGLALTGFSQQALKEVEAKRFAHNKRVLEEAKQALLMYAYNYPAISEAASVPPVARGPGRLPCPDTDNDGSPNPSFFCISGSPIVGRLPWDDADLNFFDGRDASGSRLWYAVSRNFANTGPAIVNSDSAGTITIFEQTGNILYDGVTNGVAAVIIAPGAPLAGQDRNADPLDPANYLDSFGAFDNSVFVNGENDPDDGFRLGPVTNNSTLVMNDQMIFITADEVIEMAEKAVLEEYRNAINDYLDNTDDTYPWLYNYVGVSDIAGLSTYFPGNSNFATELSTNLDNIGRIPSIFTDYFTQSDSQEIESEIAGTVSFNYPVATPIGRSSGSDFEFNGGTQSVNFASTNVLTNVKFIDQGGTVRLTATAGNFEQFSGHTYFWDDEDSPTGIWTICPNGGGSLSDCNQDSAGNPTTGFNDKDLEILQMTLVMKFDPAFNGGVINFDADYSTAPVLDTPPFPAASGTAHAQIFATMNGADVNFSSLPPITAFYDIDDEYLAGESTFVPSESGTLDDVADLNLGSLSLGLRYYPELPGWAFDNGWHNSLMMAYADDYRPDSVTPPCSEGIDCIQVNNMGGNNDDKISILVIAGQHDWVDNGAAGLTDDLDTVFDFENEDLDRVFDVRAANGNDKIMIVDEL